MPGRPLVVYDGACGFCNEEVARLRRLAGGGLSFESFREPGFFERHPELDPKECEAALQLVVPSGEKPPRIYSGAEALVRAASKNRILAAILLPYFFPPIRWSADAAYRWIAKNRFRLSGGCGSESCPAHGRPGGPDHPPGR